MAFCQTRGIYLLESGPPNMNINGEYDDNENPRSELSYVNPDIRIPLFSSEYS